ncbi:MAG: hypothetical protein GY847_12550, partial [Proteobacteria bacterium]|nr:hypothetical protein [Pseudomonadota bacterium]
DEVTITLRADESGSYTGERATLILRDKIFGAYLYKRDKGELSNSVSATLPADGTYEVKVLEQSQFAWGHKFTGDYCLEMESTMGATLEPAGSVE